MLRKQHGACVRDVDTTWRIPYNRGAHTTESWHSQGTAPTPRRCSCGETHRTECSNTAMNEITTRIAVFGALEITHDPAAPRRPPTQRVLALLGYLIAHHDVPQARDKLVELLWPDLPPRQGRRMLSDTLWRARRLLTAPSQNNTPALLIAGDTVAFRPDSSTWVDLIVFEHYL